MKHDIVFSMLMFLLSKKKSTATEIAQKLEISERTVYRYVNALTLSDIPVQTSAGREGGIWIDESCKLAFNFFSPKEKRIIWDSLTAYSNSENQKEIDVIMQKLRSLKGVYE